MVTISKRGAIYYAQYRHDGKQTRVSLKTSNRKVAEQHRLKLELELAQRSLGLAPVASVVPEQEEPVVPLAEIRSGYEAFSKANKRPKTVLNDTSRLCAFFETVPGLEMTQIRTSHVERYLTAVAADGRSPATVLRNREILHAFWRWAVRQGFAEANVVSDIPRPRLPERDPVFLNSDQITELLAAVAGTAVEGPVATALFGGLRREELCWLTTADIDQDRLPLMLRVRAKCIGGEKWQPKTKRDRRLPVSDRLEVLLAPQLQAKRSSRCAWLFPSPAGLRWDPDNLGRSIRAVLKASGLLWNLLEFRHTFGSQLALKATYPQMRPRSFGSELVTSNSSMTNEPVSVSAE